MSETQLEKEMIIISNILSGKNLDEVVKEYQQIKSAETILDCKYIICTNEGCYSVNYFFNEFIKQYYSIMIHKASGNDVTDYIDPFESWNEGELFVSESWILNGMGITWENINKLEGEN